MKKKIAKLNREASIRTIAIASFLLVLLFSLATLSYAWYRNYVDIKGTSVTTGSLSFSVESYNVDMNGNVTGPTIFSANEEERNAVVLNTDVSRITSWNNVPHHVYYFIKNPANQESIDLDASLQLSLDNAEIPEEIGGINVEMSQVAFGKLEDDFAEEISDEAVKEEISNKVSSIVLGNNLITFSNLENAYREFSVKKGEYVCIRLTYVVPSNITTYTDIDLAIRISLCLAQKGGLPGDNTSTEYVVYTDDGFASALGKYRPNDKILVKGNVNYVGDLVLNRPLALEVQNSDLIIHGNLTYAYPYQGHFIIDTSRGGRIGVIKKAVEQTDEMGNVLSYTYVGGTFEIIIPQAQIEFIGKNSSVAGRGDIYVQDEFNVSASKTTAGSNTDNGFIISESRIISTNGIVGDSEEFKQINVGSYTKIVVLNHSVVGPIVAQSGAKVIEIENRGTIASLDLYDMHHDGTYENIVTYEAHSPQILIDNYGAFTNSQILLPINWARKYNEIEVGVFSGNTRIVSHPGAEMMTTNTCSGFWSDGSRNPNNDHIEYVKLDTFIEKVNDNPTDIIVNYTPDTDLYLVGTDKKIGSTLQSLIEYYSGVIKASSIVNDPIGSYVNEELKIASVGAITSMKIVSFNTPLTSDDYSYIKSKMTQLRSLDLADAYSVDFTLPNYALSDMKQLVNFVPSEYDHTWANRPLTGTGIEEIYLPESLKTVYSQTLHHLKCIHTNTTLITYIQSAGQRANLAGTILLVPDVATYNLYMTSNTYYGRVFLEADRYVTDNVEYYLRLSEANSTCEVVTMAGVTSEKRDTIDMSLESKGGFFFDFNNIIVDDKRYEVISYDNYAFYAKTFLNVTDITFSSHVQTIMANAFNAAKGIKEITFEGNSISLGEGAFQDSSITKITAEDLTEVGRRAFAGMTMLNWAYLPSLTKCDIPFNGCKENLVRVDVGVLKDGSVLLDADHARYLFIHTKETDVPPSYVLTGQGWSQRMTFMPSSFSSMYSSIGNKILLPEGYDVDDIKSYYNKDDPAERNDMFLPNLLYIENEDTTVTILACCDPLITSSDEAFVIPREDGSGNYVVSEIGKCAYTFTDINIVGDLVFPTSVTKVNDYAFSTNLNGNADAIGTKFNTKTYVRLIFNNVEYVGISAFRGNTCAEIVGRKVETIWQYAFGDNKSLVTIELPAWRTSQKSSSWGYHFYGCDALKMALIGPTDKGNGDWAFYYAPNLSLVIVDGTVAPAKMPNGNFQAYGDNVNPLPIIFYKGSISGNYTTNVKVVPYKDMCLSDFVTQTTVVNGVSYSYKLPSTVYYKTDGGGSVVYAKFMAASIPGETYTIPQRIKEKENKQILFGEEVQEYTDVFDEEEGYPIVSIVAHSFFKVSLGEKTFYTGKFVTSIGNSIFSGTGIKNLILENVESVGSSAFSGSSVASITANRLKTVGASAFENCKNLKEIVLPAVQGIGTRAFMGSGVEIVNLGEHLKNIDAYAFCNCASLKEVTIRSETPITNNTSTTDTAIKNSMFYHSSYKNTPVDMVRLLVPASVREYYLGGWQHIPEQNVNAFELSWYDEANEITYFFNNLGDGKVEISSIDTETVLSGTYVFPSSFTSQTVDGDGNVTSSFTYTITKISDTFMKHLIDYGEIVKYVLPEGLEEFPSDYSIVSPYVRELEIASSNAYFATDTNGILYNKDYSILLFYPRAKVSESVAIPSSVKLVVESAFANVHSLESITFLGDVILSAGVFDGCLNLSKVTFNDNVVFAGRNIFNNCNEDLVIYVPLALRSEIISDIVYDKSIADKIVGV